MVLVTREKQHVFKGAVIHLQKKKKTYSLAEQQAVEDEEEPALKTTDLHI